MTIRWITRLLGTAPASDVLGVSDDICVIDVRDMVDKGGNRVDFVRAKIDDGVVSLREGRRTIVCCDYGISRSNAVAAGILALYDKIEFSEAVRKVQSATGESEIKPEPLNSVRQAIAEKKTKVDPMSRPRVLVTGASGFIGRALLPVLSARFDVCAPTHAEIDLEAGNTKLGLLVKENEVECIVHLANPRVYTSNRAVGVALTMLRNVIEICSTHDIRLIYLSGWEVYSAYAGSMIANEALPLYPKGPYGDTKYLAEMLIEQHARAGTLKSIVLRSGPVYGLGSDRPKFIFNFLEKARAGATITTHRYTNGYPALDLMHVDDLAKAIAECVAADAVGSFNLGTGVLTDTFKIANDIRNILGSKSELGSVNLDVPVASIAMDYSKARDILGWSPSISFEAGLRGLIR